MARHSRSPVTAIEVDLSVGGRYRYAFRRPDGVVFALAGTFKEIADDRIVFTQGMEDQPGGDAVVTTTFVKKGGRTTMTVVLRFPTQEIRDFVLATGMADGAGESYDNLATLLERLREGQGGQAA